MSEPQATEATRSAIAGMSASLPGHGRQEVLGRPVALVAPVDPDVDIVTP